MNQESNNSEMFQVTFSKQCMRALNSLPKHEQLTLVDKISSLNEQSLQKPSGDLGKFNRKGHSFYRLRADEHRIYFEQDGNQLKCHFILHKNTLSDFIFRCKLPIGNEQKLEEHNSFLGVFRISGKGPVNNLGEAGQNKRRTKKFFRVLSFPLARSQDLTHKANHCFLLLVRY